VRPRVTVITLGVENLERSLRFYRDGLGFPTEGIVGAEFEHGKVAFFDLQPGLKLALWGRADLAHESRVDMDPPSAAELSLGHNAASREQVDAVIEEARRAGARVTVEPHPAFWGGYTASFQDPDGHLWEVAWNPFWPVPD